MKNIKSLILAALLGMPFTSCNDFLNLEPLNDIVLENFWTDKADVESVLLGAYSALESSDCLQRMVVWGEMRSDNMIEGNGTGEDIRQIFRENLLITNQYCKYSAFYDVVNRANTVLHFAPIVADKDPNYLMDELLSNEAEAIALRALCYWYLIRTFRDVPYVTEPSIDDEGGHMKFYVPQSSFDAVLDSIIGDLEYVKKYIVNKYASEDANTCRVTKSTICAMLADMYLWRGAEGDWDKCIAVCEEVTALKLADYEKLRNKQGKNCTIELFNGYPLITESQDGAYAGNSYEEIFGEGYSFESLFEFPYDDNVKNPFVSNYYQSNNSNNVGQVKALQDIGDGFDGKTKGNTIFEQPLDTRYYQNLKKYNTSYAIAKYAYSDINVKIDEAGSIQPTSSMGGSTVSYGSIRNQVQANWIVYRYSEVLLFEAEAYIQKAKALSPEGADSTSISNQLKEYKDKAFNLIDAVNQRSIAYNIMSVKASNPKTLTKLISYSSDATSVSVLEETLFKERRRELIFEGKRWYDLVRMARREGNQDGLLRFIEKKHDAATLSAVKIKLKNPYYMYFPLHKDEVRNSEGILKQNPAYKDEENIEQASH